MSVGGEFAILIACHQLKIDEMPATFYALAADLAIDREQIALWVVAPNFGVEMHELRIIADPVSHDV